MDESNEILIVVGIIIAISIILLFVFMKPKKYYKYYKDEDIKYPGVPNNSNETNLGQIISTKMFDNIKSSYPAINSDSEYILEESIGLMARCYSNKLIEFYKKRNINDIRQIIYDYQNDNLPYDFDKTKCIGIRIAALYYLNNILGSDFDINKALQYIQADDKFKPAFIEYITGKGVYNFTTDQLAYLDAYPVTKF